jgi:hypothetical protein
VFSTTSRCSRFTEASRLQWLGAEVIFMSSVVRIVSLAAVGIGILGAVGCNRDRTDRDRVTVPAEQVDRDHGPGTTTVTGANVGVVSNQLAIEKIVAARCARESTCNNIGPDKSHVNGQACSQKLRYDMKDDLNAKDCPRGIDQKELNECLDEIRKESCNNPIDTINRLAACRTGDMCLKTDTPNR